VGAATYKDTYKDTYKEGPQKAPAVIAVAMLPPPAAAIAPGVVPPGKPLPSRSPVFNLSILWC